MDFGEWARRHADNFSDEAKEKAQHFKDGLTEDEEEERHRNADKKKEKDK